MHMTPSAIPGDQALRALEGLRAHPRRLPSDYFYDDEGSRLFQRIMDLPEYYLTRAEHDVLQRHGLALLRLCAPRDEPFELIELGSGDGSKTIELCGAFLRAGARFVYHPIDISRHALDSLCARFRERLPALTVVPRTGDYFAGWGRGDPAGPRRVVMFMGSNLGNMPKPDAMAFLRLIRHHLRDGDGLMLGLDLVKNPHTILAAYNDAQGITAAFNLNLLRRLNRELGMDFDLRRFSHYASYCPLDGTARSFLVSLARQRVSSTVLDTHLEFSEGEVIYTEQSQKYSEPMIQAMAQGSGFVPGQHLLDATGGYCVSFWQAGR